jgi:hypothetical protein
MNLTEFTWNSQVLGPKELLGAIETAIPAATIDKAIELSNSHNQRQRALPTPLVVALVIALNLWSRDSIVDVLKNLVTGLSGQWIRLCQRWKVPTKSSISEARQRVGPQVMSRLLSLLMGPQATEGTPGAFLNGLRLMAVDGSTIDVPDTPSNARVFGYPGSRKGTRAAFPKVRLVFLVEVGTHILCDALLSPYRMHERVRVRKLLRSVGQGMLLMWDRGLHSFKMVNETLAQQCHYLGRVPANAKFAPIKALKDGSYLSWIVPDRLSLLKGAKRIQVRVIEYCVEEAGEQKTYRLITDLLDVALFPALLLAQEYHQRWEAENTLSEFKTFLNGRKVALRSKQPRLVIQELYGWLVTHWVLRTLMFQAAQQKQISPLSLSFTGSLKVLRRAIPQFQSAKTQELPVFWSWLMHELLEQTIPPRQGRSNPRVVKKTRSKFPARKPKHSGHGTQRQQLSFSIAGAA